MDSTGFQSEFIISMQLTPEGQEVLTNTPSATRNRQPANNVRRNRTAFTPDQEAELKAEFAECSSLYSSRRKQIADKLGLCERVVKVWFQNQRQKVKRERQARSIPKMECTETRTPTATGVPSTTNDVPEVPVIPVFKPKTASMVTDLVPISRDPSKRFKPQLIVSFSGGLPETSTKKTPTPMVTDNQTQPDAAILENQLSEFLVVRSRDRPDVGGQSSATPRLNIEDVPLRNQQDLQNDQQEPHGQQNAYFHQQGTFKDNREHPLQQLIPASQQQQNKLTYTLHPVVEQQGHLQHDWNTQVWQIGQKPEVQSPCHGAQPHHQEPFIQQTETQDYMAFQHMQAAAEQHHQQEVRGKQGQTPCPAHLLQQELEAYSNHSFYGHECLLSMAPPHQPLQEDIPQYAHFSFEDCINQFPDHHLAESQPSLNLDTSLSLEQEIDKYLANPIVDEENINISEFLDYIGMEPELGLDLPDQGAEKSIPHSALAPPIDLGFNFDF